MSGLGQLDVVGVGLLNAVGLHGRSVTAACRAGVCRYRESDYRTSAGDDVTLALVSEDAFEATASLIGKPPTRRAEYMLGLAVLAAREALAPLVRRQGVAIPILLSGPEPVPKGEPPIGADLLQTLAERCNLKLHDASKMDLTGGAGAIASIASALALIEKNIADFVLVGGVDSPRERAFLDLLQAQRRLRVGDAVDGYTPGEGAAFLLLTKPHTPPRLPSFARVSAPAVAMEKGHRLASGPRGADGLAEAVRGALTGRDGPVRSVLAGLTGESFLAREWAIANMRNADHVTPNAPLWHPADCFGGLGAASGASLMAMAAVSLSQGYMNGPALVWTASEGAMRGAIWMARSAHAAPHSQASGASPPRLARNQPRG